MGAPTNEQIRAEIEEEKKRYLAKHGEEGAAIGCHSHSAFSLTWKGFIGSDGEASIDEMFRTAKERGLDGLLLTNHDNLGPIDPILEAAEKENVYTLPAIEVSSKDGHVIGVFPKTLTNKKVKDKFGNTDRSFPDVSAEETAGYVHELGGVAIAAHPYYETVGLGRDLFRKLAGKFDGMESAWTEEGKADNATFRLADIGSSDAHTKNGVGARITLIPKRYMQEEGGLLKAIRERKCETFLTSYHDGLGDYDLTNISTGRFLRMALFTPIMGGMLYRNRRGRRIEEQMIYEKLEYISSRLKNLLGKFS